MGMNSEWEVQKNRKLMSWKVRHGSGPVTKSRFRYSQKMSNSWDSYRKFVKTSHKFDKRWWKSTYLAQTHIQGCQLYWNSISDQLANPIGREVPFLVAKLLFICYRLCLMRSTLFFFDQTKIWHLIVIELMY